MSTIIIIIIIMISSSCCYDYYVLVWCLAITITTTTTTTTTTIIISYYDYYLRCSTVLHTSHTRHDIRLYIGGGFSGEKHLTWNAEIWTRNILAFLVQTPLNFQTFMCSSPMEIPPL